MHNVEGYEVVMAEERSAATKVVLMLHWIKDYVIVRRRKKKQCSFIVRMKARLVASNKNK